MKKELEVNQLDSTELKSKEVDEKIKVDSVKPIEIEKKLNPKRLYLRNLAFEVKEEDIRITFEKYGEVTEIHIPINRRTNSSFGYAYVSYATVESSIMALSEMDKTYFQGRIMHITVAMEKQEKILTAPKQEAATGSSEFKKEKKFKMKTNYDNETNWNYLFMNQNAVIESVANKLNIPKSEIMSRDNPNLAVQVAAMETTVLNETKDWLTSNGINLDSLKGKRSECVRSKNIILIKNISCTISREKLEEYFSRYGMLVRFLISPSNTMGLAEFVDKKHAENCMKKLAYFEIDNLPLYLEFSPEGLIKKTNNQEIIKTDASNKTEIDLKKGQGKILFFSNLNFSTKESRLKKFLEEKGFNPINVKIVTHKKDDSDKLLSSGFGFVEFEDEETAQKAIRNLQGNLLDAHSLKIDIAKTSKEDKEKFLNNKRKNETELNDYDYEGELVTNNKIHVKNLAFEANKEELRKLFKTFGEVKSLRIPTKLDGTHRGFAFIEFVSHDEAKSAFKSLQNTHFYGRKLVLEWAQKEKTVEDLRLQTERKVNAINIKTHRKQTKGEFEIK
jgi:multiple RNA-binding domain-containing protein 1